ncbi:glycosyltransferase [Desulfobacter postgatei]|jgi:hypothetical protein|uniref:glycosyltransferase family 2 protein n=1 Tax=Desulfobacter postgatei TaxID=2293 RepID=UPI002A36DB56|nr:glycosyltransferase [Desulfobacter postgatei]MDX9964224.1 glycosyltransferase [Desulfobacter postgatei]
MRACIFTSDIDKTAVQKEKVLEDIAPSVKAAPDNIYVTGYGWPSARSTQRKIYPLENRNSLKMKVCCTLLGAVDRNRWIPSRVARIPLLMIQEEVIETILSFAPDAMIFHGLRWGEELNSMVKRHLPDLPCLSGERDALDSIHWRKYDSEIKVSIVLPTYNGAKYIRTSIDSCLAQTHTNLEVIVVDDCSTDDTPDIVKSYSDPRIKYIRHSENQKLPRSLNTGFKNADGHFLTWTSDDNIFHKEAVEVMLKFLLTYPETGFVYTDLHHIDDHSNVFEYFSVGPVESLRKTNLIGACFLYPRKVYEEIGEYDASAFLAEDYDYWIRISKKFKMQRLRVPLYYFRIHKDSLTSKFGRLGTDEAGEVGKIVKKRHKIG